MKNSLIDFLAMIIATLITYGICTLIIKACMWITDYNLGRI